MQHRPAARAISLALAIGLLLAGLLAGAWAGAEPNPCSATNDVANLYLSQTATQSGTAVWYVLTVTNVGPCSGTGVSIADALPFDPATPACNGLERSWSCSVDGRNVRATLTSTIPPAGTAVVAVKATMPTATAEGVNVATVSNSVEGDEDLTDNTVTGGITSVVTATAGTQTATVALPARAAIALQQIRSRFAAQQQNQTPSPLAAAAAAPCEGSSACVTSREVLAHLPEGDTDPAVFPKVHITVTLVVPAGGLNSTSSVTVYRFNEGNISPASIPVGTWAPLRKCAGFTGDPDVGCVKSLTLDKKAGTLTIVIWTSHNGHLR